MARKATSKPDSGTSQSSATIGLETLVMRGTWFFEGQSSTLAAQCDTLLPKLLSGEIHITNFQVC